MLGNTLSGALQAKIEAVVNDVEELFILFEDVVINYEDDQYFVPIVNALREELPTEAEQKAGQRGLFQCFS